MFKIYSYKGKKNIPFPTIVNILVNELVNKLIFEGYMEAMQPSPWRSSHSLNIEARSTVGGLNRSGV